MISKNLTMFVTLVVATGCAQFKVESNGRKKPADDRAAKLMADDCVDPDLSLVATGQSITLCDGTQAEGAFDISNLTAANIKSGVSIAGIDGSVVPSPANCAADGGTGCVATTSYPAANANDLIPANIKKGVTLGGVSGSKRDIKNCRNAAHLATWDASGVSNLYLGFTVPHTNIDDDNDVIDLGFAHGMSTGFPLRITTDTTMPSGVTSGQTYYATNVTSNTIQISATPAGAALPIDQGSGDHTIAPVADAVASLWDTIDDSNAGLGTSPSDSPWGSEYICDATNFENVTGDESNLQASGTPSGATAAFSQIWQDNLTGLYFTNILYNISGSVTWADGMRMCSTLDSGDGAGPWRLPTQKELMQFHINGIANLTVAGGTWTNQGMWSSSVVSYDTFYAWIVSLSSGFTANVNRNHTHGGVFCVR
jgi:hypothetical protein